MDQHKIKKMKNQTFQSFVTLDKSKPQISSSNSKNTIYHPHDNRIDSLLLYMIKKKGTNFECLVMFKTLFRILLKVDNFITHSMLVTKMTFLTI